MRFVFSPKKSAQAAAYVLDLRGGEEWFLKLIKLLYIADRRTLKDHGAPITGAAPWSMEHGPVLSEVYDLLKPRARPKTPWDEYVVRDGDHARLNKKLGATDTNELSKFELRTLKAVVEEFGSWDRWELVGWLHKNFPEWDQKVGKSSSPIQFEQILEAQGASAEEIEQIKAEAELHWKFHNAAS